MVGHSCSKNDVASARRCARSDLFFARTGQGVRKLADRHISPRQGRLTQSAPPVFLFRRLQSRRVGPRIDMRCGVGLPGLFEQRVPFGTGKLPGAFARLGRKNGKPVFQCDRLFETMPPRIHGASPFWGGGGSATGRSRHRRIPTDPCGDGSSVRLSPAESESKILKFFGRDEGGTANSGPGAWG